MNKQEFEQANRRRIALIWQRHFSRLTLAESFELARLSAEVRAHVGPRSTEAVDEFEAFVGDLKRASI